MTAIHKVGGRWLATIGRLRAPAAWGDDRGSMEVEELMVEEVTLALGGEDGVAEPGYLTDKSHDGVGAAGGGMEEEVDDGEAAVTKRTRLRAPWTEWASSYSAAIVTGKYWARGQVGSHRRRWCLQSGHWLEALPPVSQPCSSPVGSTAANSVEAESGVGTAVMPRFWRARRTDCRSGCMQMRITRVVFRYATF